MRTTGGLCARISTLGATIIGLDVPDRAGVVANVVLGFDTLERHIGAMRAPSWPYFGCTVGRYANRIGGARFVIDATPYSLARNEGQNHLHGGTVGFDRAVWRGEPLPCGQGVRLRHASPDGDQGYPGSLTVTANFLMEAPRTPVIRYSARTDRATHVNLTNHSYFNLARRDARQIADHTLRIAADRFLPIDDAGLPNDSALDVTGSPFDFRKERLLGDAMGGDHPQLLGNNSFNHCYVMNAVDGAQAMLHHPPSGRSLSIRTSEPGLQPYSANHLPPELVDNAGVPFGPQRAVGLETQHFPNSPNTPAYPTTPLRAIARSGVHPLLLDHLDVVERDRLIGECI